MNQNVERSESRERIIYGLLERSYVKSSNAEAYIRKVTSIQLRCGFYVLSHSICLEQQRSFVYNIIRLHLTIYYYNEIISAQLSLYCFSQRFPLKDCCLESSITNHSFGRLFCINYINILILLEHLPSYNV